MGSFSRNVHKWNPDRNKKRISRPDPNPDAGFNPVPRSQQKANILLSSGETNLSNEQNKDKERQSKERNERSDNGNNQELKEDPSNEEHPRPDKKQQDDLDVDSGEKNGPGKILLQTIWQPLKCQGEPH